MTPSDALLRDAMQLLHVAGMWKAPVDEQWRESYRDVADRYAALRSAPVASDAPRKNTDVVSRLRAWPNQGFVETIEHLMQTAADTIEAYAHELDEADRYAALRPGDGWVDTEERLPREVGMVVEVRATSFYHGDAAIWQAPHITHWRPRPEGEGLGIRIESDPKAPEGEAILYTTRDGKGSPEIASAVKITGLPTPTVTEREAVEFREGYDGEWTCSGCKQDWVCEAEDPETNGYKYCPGCGARIGKYVPCEMDNPLDDPAPKEGS